MSLFTNSQKRLSPSRFSTKLKFFGFTAASAIALTACGGEGDGSETIVIGYSGPLSGGAALYGENVQAGLEMAVEELNEQGVEIDGTEYSVELRSLDDEYSPATAATNAQRLVEQDGAPVVVIPHAGGINAAQEINTSRSEFLLAAYSSDPRITQQDNELTMMSTIPFTAYAQPYTQHYLDDGAETLGLLATASEYGQQWTDMITETWEENGGEVLSNNNFDYGSVTDFSTNVSQALAQDPDVLLVGGPSQPTALVIEEAREQGYEGGFMVMDQAKFEEMEIFTDPENLHNSVGLNPTREYDEPGTDALVDKFAEKVNDERPINAEVAMNYQALGIIVTAMEVSGSTDDPTAVREAIPEALDQVDDAFRVQEFPSDVTPEGMSVAGHGHGIYINEDGDYENFELDWSVFESE